MNFKDPVVLFSSVGLYLKFYHLFYNRQIFILEPFQREHHDLFLLNHFFVGEYNFQSKQWIFQSHLNRSKIFIHLQDGYFEKCCWNSLVIDNPDDFDYKLFSSSSTDASKLIYIPDYALQNKLWYNHQILAHFDDFNLIKTHPYDNRALLIFECQDWPHLLSITDDDYKSLLREHDDFCCLFTGSQKLNKLQLQILQAIGNEILFDFFQSSYEKINENFERLVTHITNLGNLQHFKEHLLFRVLPWLFDESKKSILHIIKFSALRMMIVQLGQVLSHSQKVYSNYHRHQILFLYSPQFQQLLVHEHDSTKSKTQFLHNFLKSFAHLNDIIKDTQNSFVRNLVFYGILTDFDAFRMLKFSNTLRLMHFCYLLTTKDDQVLNMDVSPDLKDERELVQHWRNIHHVDALDLIKDLVDPDSQYICFKRRSTHHPLLPDHSSFVYQYAVHCIVNWKNNLSTPKPHPAIFRLELNLSNSRIDVCDANNLFDWKKMSKKRKRYHD